jgi:hypothetical protein
MSQPCRLHLPGLLQGHLLGDLPAAPQLDVSYLIALSPGGHPAVHFLNQLLEKTLCRTFRTMIAIRTRAMSFAAKMYSEGQ